MIRFHLWLQRKGRIVLFSILFWFFYAVYYFIVNRMAAAHISPDELLYVIPLFAGIATGTYLILCRWLRPGHWWAALLIMLFFYSGVIAFTYGLLHVLAMQGHPTAQVMLPKSWIDGRFISNMLGLIGRYSMFGVVGFVLKQMIAHARAKQVEAKARRSYEYVMLAGQVSPHFMANLFYHWTTELHQEQTGLRQKVHQAYELMVYYMEALQTGRRRILLTREIEQLQQYIALCSKKDLPAYIKLDITGDLTGYTVPPVTLLTLMENAVKYGRTDLPDQPIRMQVSLQDKVLHIQCDNLIRPNAETKSHGMGLANLRRRLELEFSDRFRLSSSAKGTRYTAKLIIAYE